MANPLRFAADLRDLPDGTMREVVIDDEKILLIRRGDEVRAVDGTCPHAGAPLAEGVLIGNRVICPWHKAEFSVNSGTCMEPPAVDDLRRIPVTVEKGRIFLDVTDAPAPGSTRAAKPDSRLFAILGAGAAGAAAAHTLRAEGFKGRLLLIDEEDALPYDRTLLSKSRLSGAEQDEKSPLQDAAFYRDNKIERIVKRVASLSKASHTLTWDDGSTIKYDAALIATGSIPVRPRFPGAGLDNVFLLRNEADAARIAGAAEKGGNAVVIGGSFIGMEVAASLRERGLDVTVIAQQSAPFEPQLGTTIGRVFQTMHEERGVRFRFGSMVERLIGETAVAQVVLTNGDVLEADLVVAGLGVRPATDFLADLPRREDGGLDTDTNLRVADGLYAAGDIAGFALRGDGPMIRVEHWRVAQQQGRIAAVNMLGGNRTFDAVPYFWTIHFMNRLDYVGHGSGSDDLVVRGDLKKSQFIAYYCRDGRITAAAGLNQDRDMAAVLALMGEQRNWSVDDIHPADSSPAAILEAREIKQIG